MAERERVVMSGGSREKGVWGDDNDSSQACGSLVGEPRQGSWACTFGAHPRNVSSVEVLGGGVDYRDTERAFNRRKWLQDTTLWK